MDDTIESTRKVIEQTKKVKQGLLQELLTKGIGHKKFKDTEIGRIPVEWEVVSIGDVASASSGGTPSRSHPEFWNGDIPWVKTAEIKYLEITHTEESITRAGIENSAAKIIPQGAVLMAMYGQGKTRGQVAMLGIDAALNQACLALVCTSVAVNRFLFFYLSSQYENLRGLSQEGSQKNLSATLIKNVKVPLPPLSEQEKIADILTGVDEKIAAQKKELNQLQTIKKGLMQDLLTGRVRVKV